MLKYKFKETKKIKKLLTELEALKTLLNQIKIPPHIEKNLRQESLLKSALFSARIEGNPLSLEELKELPEDFLLPRRREILEIIKDHPYCSFDFISRRFLSINQKTLHYDLKQLQEKGFVIKAGITRGVKYKTRE